MGPVARTRSTGSKISERGGAGNAGSGSERWVHIRMVFCFALGALLMSSFQNASVVESDIRQLEEARVHSIPPPPTRRMSKVNKPAAKEDAAPEKTAAVTHALAASPGSNEIAQAAAAAAREAKRKANQHAKYNVTYEEVEKLMQDETTKTAGQQFLDFAILGHAKCGTSTMMYWLAAHPEVAAFEWEITVLQSKNPWDLVRRVHKGLPAGSYKRGYKSPNDVENLRVIRLLREYFPKTKIMVGMRHPVRWFESFYNYRIQNGYKMPPAEGLKTRCMGGQNNVCIDRARYHVNLAAFGKTPLSEDELNVFSPRSHREIAKEKNPYSPNTIYLYDTAQLADKNTERIQIFRNDLKEYVGLSDDLPPAMHVSPGHKVNATEQALRDSRKIDICEPKFAAQRAELLVIGGEIKTWLQQYFLKSPDVMVSNREHFDEILETYTSDPCDGVRKAVTK